MKKSDKEKLRAISEDLSKILPPMLEKVRHYATMSNRTPDEEKEYRELIDLVVRAKPAISMLKDYFDNEINLNATAYYYSIKQKAEDGDPKAKEIISELAPLYEQALLEQMDKN